MTTLQCRSLVEPQSAKKKKKKENISIGNQTRQRLTHPGAVHAIIDATKYLYHLLGCSLDRVLLRDVDLYPNGTKLSRRRQRLALGGNLDCLLCIKVCNHDCSSAFFGKSQRAGLADPAPCLFCKSIDDDLGSVRAHLRQRQKRFR